MFLVNQITSPSAALGSLRSFPRSLHRSDGLHVVLHDLCAASASTHPALAAHDPVPRSLCQSHDRQDGRLCVQLQDGTLSIFSVITTISFIVLLAQSFDLQKRYAQKDAATVEMHMHYSADLQKKATRWRSERNWWISALTFTIYWMLLRFHAVKKQLLRAQRHED